MEKLWKEEQDRIALKEKEAESKLLVSSETKEETNV